MSVDGMKWDGQAVMVPWSFERKAIGLLLQSLQHISVKSHHDAEDGGGGASCTLVTGIRGAVRGNGKHLRGVLLAQWCGMGAYHPALSQLDRNSGWRVKNDSWHVGKDEAVQLPVPRALDNEDKTQIRLSCHSCLSCSNAQWWVGQQSL